MISTIAPEDGEPFVPDWVLPLWPLLKPIVMRSLDEQTDDERAELLAAIAAGPGGLLIRELDGIVHIAAGRPLKLFCSVPLLAVLPPDDGRTH